MNIHIWEMRRSIMIKIYFSCRCYQKRVSGNATLRTFWCQWSAKKHNVMFDWMSSNSLKCFDGATCRAMVCFSFLSSAWIIDAVSENNNMKNVSRLWNIPEFVPVGGRDVWHVRCTLKASFSLSLVLHLIPPLQNNHIQNDQKCSELCSW